MLIPCKDCGTNKFVSANEHADSYYACMFWNVACSNPECQKRFWANNHMPQCTNNFDTKEQAITEWNKGNSFNFPFSSGGRWTGD